MKGQLFIEIPKCGTLDDLAKAMLDSFQQMTPEQQERFQKEMREVTVIQLLDVDEIKIEILKTISPTAERMAVSIGIACKNCGLRIEPVVMNGVMSRSWTHLHRRLGYGAGCWCSDDGDSKAEPYISESEEH
jgi:hypothetical protein